MTKKEKVLLIICVVAFLVACIMVFPTMGREIDCRGEVKSINYDEAEHCYYIRVLGSADDVEYNIRATQNTRVTYITYNGKRSSVEKIQVGNVISLNYRGKWKNKDTVLRAKWIVIEY